MNKLKTGARAGAYSAILTAVVIAVAIVVNLIVNSLPSKFLKLDTTSDSMFTFDEKTEEFIKGLSEEVTIYHVAQSGAEDPYLSEVLERYSDMNGRIKVQKVDPATQPAFTSKYTEEAVSNNSMIIESADRFKLVPSNEVYYIYCEQLGGKIDSSTYEYYAQMYYQYYGTQLEASSVFAGESVVAAGIDYVTMTDIPKVYILSGHDEPALNSALTEWLKLKNYETAELTLTEEVLGLEGGSAVVEDVPADADMVLITGLSEDITTEELNRLTAYVSGGGKLLVMSNYTMAELPNFTKLAATYGINTEMSLVIENDTQYYSGSQFNVKAQIGEDSGLSGISNIFMPYSHGMKLAETMPEGMSATTLLKTSDKAFAKKAGFDTQDRNYVQRSEGDVDGPILLGVKVEQSGGGSVAWLASNYYMIQDDMYGSGTGANSVFTSVVGDVCGAAETISIRTIQMTDTYLSVTDGSANIWGIIIIGIIPLTFIGVGLAVWMRRRSN